jgi:hypothetical protein
VDQSQERRYRVTGEPIDQEGPECVHARILVRGPPVLGAPEPHGATIVADSLRVKPLPP